MNFKLAVLFLFGFVALAVAVPLANTEEKAGPAEFNVADAEKADVPLEEAEAGKSKTLFKQFSLGNIF